MPTFLTADWHYGDENIVEYCGRPVTDVNDMNSKILSSYIKTISKEDNVFFLGDIFHNLSPEEISAILGNLPGRKILVMGNHEVEQSYFPEYWSNLGYQVVHDFPILFAQFFLLSHERVQWIDSKGAYANIHGHEHNRVDLPILTTRTLNVGIDNWGAPITLEFAKGLLKQQPKLSRDPEEIWDDSYLHRIQADLRV